jgi:NifU-like protein involved in Fe-S cluster formation
MLNDIYSQRLLELAANIPHLGRLAHADGTAKVHARLCGSSIVVDLCVRDGIVTDFAHEVQACALGQAAASLMAQKIIGSRAEDLIHLRDVMHKMLEEDGHVPQPPWQDFALFESIKPYNARHASTLLAFDAVVKALQMAGVSSPGA